MNRLLVLIASGLVLASATLAMPPREDIPVSQAEWAEQARLGINVAKTPVRDAGMRGVTNGPGSVRELVVGTKRFPVSAIRFPDFTSTNTIAQFDSMLFGIWPSGSARDYYEQVSYGQFHMVGQTFGWFTSTQNRAYYGYANGWQRGAMLVKEAAQQADASVNYAQYDNDDDGYVDAFTCIHAGMGREESGNGADIWSHSWDFNSAGIGEYVTNDPWPGHSGQYIKVNDYTVDPERSNYTNHGGMVSIGVFCHEWGHALGLPDLYDTDGGGQGLGCWSLMATGSWGANNSSPWYPAHLDPWCKMELGWLNPTAVRRRNLYSLSQVETNAKAYWLMSRERLFREYFLVENRRKTLFDTLMYNQGLLIYHIDDSVALTRWSNNAVNAGGTGWRYGVALEQADGADHLYSGGNRGDANDPWPGGLGRTLYDSTSTTPNSRTNYPTSSLVTGCLAKNIPASATVMACTLASGITGLFTGGPDAAGYTWIDSDTTGGPAQAWNDISTTGTLLGYGDDTRWSFGLPYSFNFYGTGYSTVWVSSNGWLSFGTDPGTSAPANQAVPNAAAPNGAVFAFWDDLNGFQPDSGGVYYRNMGSSPNCSTVVMWKHSRVKPSIDPVQNQVSFEVVLYEDGRIQVRYRDLWLTDSLRRWGRSATAGIENPAGSTGLAYLYNGTPAGNLLANERTVEFRPRHDVGATRIVQPSGATDSGNVVTPACSVYNYGSTSETYDVRMRIGALYNQSATVTGHAPGTAAYVTFPGWTALPRGILAVTCSTGLGTDVARANDRQIGSATVAVRDAASGTILAPTGTVDSGTAVQPRATVRNPGTDPSTFAVRLVIGSAYADTQQVTALLPESSLQVSFRQWTADRRGLLAVACSTMLSGDMVQSNDRSSGSLTVAVHDVQVSAITAPAAFVLPGAVTPAARVRNNGTTREPVRVTFSIAALPPYLDSIVLPDGLPVFDTALSFRTWNAPPGRFAAGCTVYMASDQVPANNGRRLEFTAGTPGWNAMSPVPMLASGRQVKDGAWLAWSGTTGRVYAAKGNKTGDFYGYDAAADSWKTLAAVPAGIENKPVGKGGAGCADGTGFIYALKGNNTQAFWRYDIAKDSWQQLEDIPLGATNKKVKGGTDLAYDADSNFVYCLKGYRNEFWRYDITRDSWTAMASAPAAKYGGGSWLAKVDSLVYCHEAKNHSFYAYNLNTETWGTALTGMPLLGRLGRSKKSKDGGSATPFGNVIYSLKGGNTQEFWRYTPAGDSWAELDTMPQVGTNLKKKKVKNGGDIAATSDYLYALKGNKTCEFWRYIAGAVTDIAGATRHGTMTAAAATTGDHIDVGPNPAGVGGALVRYSLAAPAEVTLGLYDATGRLAVRLARGRQAAGEYNLRIGSSSELAAGVYVLKLVTGNHQLTRKLVFE